MSGPLRGAAVAAALCAGAHFASAAVVTALPPSPPASRASTALISPKLEPESHEVFYKHDYPDDLHPQPLHEFSHPFPIVQDSEDYDKDFVKDENSDKGEWKLQEQYDRLRGRLAHARDIAQKMEEKEWSANSRLKKTQYEEQQARARAEEALRKKLEAEARAKKRYGEAEAKYEDEASRMVGKLGIRNQSEEVGRRNMTFDECKKELEKARAELKKLQDERVAAEARLKAAQAVADEADNHAIDMEKLEAEAEARVESSKAKYSAAQRTYEHDETSLRQKQVEFLKAEGKLREFRRKADSSGGVYNSPNAAPQRAAVLPALLSVLAAATLAATAAEAA